MNSNSLRRFVVSLVCVTLVTIGFTPVSMADIVGTGTMIDAETRAENLRDIDIFLARDDVRDQLLSLGVAPEAVSARVRDLTAAELQELREGIDQQTAGGDALAVVGTVFLVLLILELLGVTNVFNAF